MADTLELKAGANVTLTEDGGNVVISAKDTIPVVDSEMSATSANAVQNKTVYAELAKKQNVLTAGEGIAINGNVIKSTDGVTIDPELSADSSNPVASKAIVAELAKKQGALTAGEGISLSDGVISSTVKAPTVAQTTGDSETSVMSQKAVTKELAKGGITMTFNRVVGLSDVEKLYFDKYWSKDLQVHSSNAGLCCAVLFRNCGYPLLWECNNYGQWQYAILCNGVNDDGSIVDGKLCLDELIDATGYKYILLTEYQGNRILNILPTYDTAYKRDGLACWVEQKNGSEAVADEMRYASRLPGVLDEFKNGNIGWKMELEKDYINLRDAMTVKNIYRTFSLIRHFPYLNMSGKDNVWFDNWVNLVDIVLGDYKINSRMFFRCRNLEHVYGFEESGLTNIPSYMFADCPKLTFRHLPLGVTSIEACAFQGCTSLALTELPLGVTSIGNGAFQGCTSLALTELPSGLTYIGQYAFQDNKNITISSIPSSVTNVGHYSFQGCKKITVSSLPEGVTFLGQHAFDGCKSITKMTLPSTLTDIKTGAFANTGIKELVCKQVTPPPMYWQNVPIEVIRVPADSVEAYKEASFWKIYADIIVAIE